MKKYERPTMEGEVFAANEYIAACHDTGAIYKFECNAPAGTLYYYKNSDGNIDGHYYGTGRPTRMGSYHPCGATHEAPVTDDFYDGFVDRNRNRKCDPGEEAIVWIQHIDGWFGGYYTGHATAKLDMDSWEEAKS